MSAFVKNKLKAAREAISKKDYEKARDASEGALEYEPDNYNANVFLGLALLELGKVEESEQAYQKAIAANPDQTLAWQGISRLYERAEKWEHCANSLEQLARRFSNADDATKCAETLQKYIELRRNHGNRTQVAEALNVLLPGSVYYPVLSTLPPPDATNPTSTTTFFAQSAVHQSLPILEDIIRIYEQEEQDITSKEIASRRTRLGAAGPEQIKKEVAREILGVSKLPTLYQEVINHPDTSDELRRETEYKLLHHKQQLLFSLPMSGDLAKKKAALRAEVQELISGMVLLEIPNELAWTLFIEGKNAYDIDEYDLGILAKFVKLFPASKLAETLDAYFGYRGMSMRDKDSDEESVDGEVQPNEGIDHADIILDNLEALPNSILAHRIVAEIYGELDDPENTVKVAESGLELVRKEELNLGIKLYSVKRAFNVLLSTALVHWFPPKHHQRALRIIDNILSEDSDNAKTLMSRGYILQYFKRWGDARQVFDHVVSLLPEDLHIGLRAKEEKAWCQAQAQDPESGILLLQEVLEIFDKLDNRDEDQARCLWRLGKCFWDIGDHESREEAYKHFITSLKRFSGFAPAFTSLGIYYSEFATPADPKRASKCFQKAFELDPREAEAARRLAEGFAEEREWDLVEVVARRTIQGEGGAEGDAATARYLPVNAWAWKAVAAVEMNRGNYPPAIQALQVALRTDSEDQLSWLRLGEAYNKAGRFAAALKALEKAKELNKTDWIASYFIGDVYRQLGRFQEAIDIFVEVLSKEQNELRVLISLGQAYLEGGRAEIIGSFRTRAESSFISSIRVTLNLVESTAPGFRRVAWKTAADALYSLSQMGGFEDKESVIRTLRETVPIVSAHIISPLDQIMTFPPTLGGAANASISRYALEVALMAYGFRVSLGSLDDVAKASALYDFGITLASYARRVAESSKEELANKEAVRCLKDALSLDPGNSQYWAGLGNVLFLSQPKTAQHAYIRALELDSKNSLTWIILGFFYLYYEDVELANKAFYKGQVLDPDQVLAWVGQGMAATLNNHQQEANALFDHAVTLSLAIPDADLEYAQRLHSRVNYSSERGVTLIDDIFPAFFVLNRLVQQRPDDATAIHLFGIVCEKIGHVELGIDLLSKAITILEAAYEETEDVVIERRFSIAHTNLARLRLSIGDYNGALESYQVVQGLLMEPTDENTAALLAQVQMGSGLATFHLGSTEEALGLLEAALATAAENTQIRGNITVLLAQVLWALQTEDGREAAKTQLLQSIEADPENLTAITTLASMGVLMSDDGLVDAALSEILSLPIDQRFKRDPGKDIPYLLLNHALGEGNITQALSVAQKAVLNEPKHSSSRLQLANLNLQRRNNKAARAMLSSTSLTNEEGLTTTRESLAVHAIAESFVDYTSAVNLAQKAVVLTPWASENWKALAYVRSTQGY